MGEAQNIIYKLLHTLSVRTICCVKENTVSHISHDRRTHFYVTLHANIFETIRVLFSFHVLVMHCHGWPPLEALKRAGPLLDTLVLPHSMDAAALAAPTAKKGKGTWTKSGGCFNTSWGVSASYSLHWYIAFPWRSGSVLACKFSWLTAFPWWSRSELAQGLLLHWVYSRKSTHMCQAGAKQVLSCTVSTRQPTYHWEK